MGDFEDGTHGMSEGSQCQDISSSKSSWIVGDETGGSIRELESCRGWLVGSWGKSDNHLARDYNIQQRVRIHHQVGPELGSFAIFLGDTELRRVDCQAETAGYAVTEAFLCDGFRIADAESYAPSGHGITL